MFSDNVYRNKTMPSALLIIWRRISVDIPALIGLYGILIFIFLCFFGSSIAPYSVDQQFLGYQLSPPSWAYHGDVSFFLGTDDLGRDIFSRLLSGAAPTFGSALLVTVCSILLGALFGVMSGISHGFRAALINHFWDAFLVIPSLLLAIVIVAFIGPGLEQAMLAVGLALIPRIVHTISRTVHDELKKEYVIAARLDGASTMYLLWNGLLPNIAPVFVAEFTRALSMAIMDISVLGFFNLGAQFPSPEWGAMLGDSLDLLYAAPWIVMLPGAAITLSILLVNLLGDGVYRAITTDNE